MFRFGQNLGQNFIPIERVHHVINGEHGEVYRGRNRSTGALVTVREFRGEEGHRFGLREIEVVSFLPAENNNVLKVLGHHWRNEGRILCVVYEYHPLMDTLSVILDRVTSLTWSEAPDANLIDAANPRVMTLQAIKLLLHQVLVALNTCHGAGVIHRRLSPKTFMVSFHPLMVLICDFRSAKCLPVLHGQIFDGYGTAEEGEGGHFTPPKRIFERSLNYSAPELLMKAITHTAAVDMWSIGLIFVEMINGTPLVENTRTKNGLLHAMYRVLGLPTTAERNSIPGIGNYQWPVLEEFPVVPPTPLAGLVPRLDPEGVALLSRMLSWNPANRITVSDALNHAYFDDIAFGIL